MNIRTNQLLDTIHPSMIREMKALADSELPLVLPELENYSPSKTGASPLDKATDWINGR